MATLPERKDCTDDDFLPWLKKNTSSMDPSLEYMFLLGIGHDLEEKAGYVHKYRGAELFAWLEKEGYFVETPTGFTFTNKKGPTTEELLPKLRESLERFYYQVILPGC